jgi:uncharacterized BrkB/YihY/UPF0761 family membrane protein
MRKQHKPVRESIFDKLEYFALRSTVLVLTLIAIAQVLIQELSSFKDLLNFEEIRHILPTLGISLLSISSLVILISLFIFLLKRRVTKTTNLKRDVTRAFMLAIDVSSFKPKEGRHEQLGK